MVMNYSEVESKVREATNDDTWGPHGSIMSEIAKYTFTYEHFPEVMSMLWKRMLQEKKNWRRVYKVCRYEGSFLSFYNGLFMPNCQRKYSEKLHCLSDRVCCISVAAVVVVFASQWF